MANLKITVPDMGDFKDVEVIEVLVKDGQTINKNDSIITLESDKSSVEVPSTHSGKIEKVNVSVGDKINKGDLILTLESNEKKEEIKKEEPKKENKVEAPVPPKEATTKNLISPVSQSGKGSASPKVRKFARELGADVSIVPGTQRSGRVSEDDVKNFIRSQVTVNQGAIQKKETSKHIEEYPHEEFGEVSVKDIPRVKKLSGPHLVRSWTEIPHVTQHEEIDITEMEHFRSSLYDYYTGEKIKVTPLAFIAKALVSALKEFPNFNASIDVNSNKITYKKYFHIGFAVDTPHGLMVPKIRNVNEMSIQKIGEELKNTSNFVESLKLIRKNFLAVR